MEMVAEGKERYRRGKEGGKEKETQREEQRKIKYIYVKKERQTGFITFRRCEQTQNLDSDLQRWK